MSSARIDKAIEYGIATSVKFDSRSLILPCILSSRISSSRNKHKKLLKQKFVCMQNSSDFYNEPVVCSILRGVLGSCAKQKWTCRLKRWLCPLEMSSSASATVIFLARSWDFLGMKEVNVEYCLHRQLKYHSSIHSVFHRTYVTVFKVKITDNFLRSTRQTTRKCKSRCLIVYCLTQFVVTNVEADTVILVKLVRV